MADEEPSSPAMEQGETGGSDNAFGQFYKSLKTASDVYQFFLRGKGAQAYFTLYGNQVERVAREYLHTTTVIKQTGSPDDPIPMVFISLKIFQNMVWDLLRNRNMKVELWEQQGREWICTVKASPGRLEELEARFGALGVAAVQDAGCVMALKCHVEADGKLKFGCGYVNPTLRILGVCEFLDTMTCTNLESFILQIGTKECLVPQKMKDTDPAAYAKIEDVLKKSGILMNQAAARNYNANNVADTLRFLLRDNGAVHDLLLMELAMSSLAAAISFLEMTSDSCNEEQFRIRKVDLSKYMKLDMAAVRALSLFDEEAETVHKTKASLLSYLDECKTSMGRRQLQVWLSQPLLDLAEIERRQDLVALFVEDTLLRDTFRSEILSKVPDLDRILKKLQRQRASLSDCMKIGNFVSLTPKISILLESYGGPYKARIADYLARVNEVSEVFTNLHELMEASLEQDEMDREVRIAPNFDEQLQQLAVERNQVREGMNAEFKRVLKELGHTDREIKMENSTQHGHYLRATKKAMGAVNACKKMIKIESRKDGLKFTSPELNRLNTQWKEISKRYQERQGTLEELFKQTVCSYLEPLDEISAIVTELDLFVSFAIVSSQPAMRAFVRPKVHPLPGPGEERKMHIRNARHPLVEYQMHIRGSTDKFVPNDVMLGSSGTLLALITGPNMGGKSTYIRTAAVCVLLAQVGMFVPCDEMELTICDAILARLGAADYLSRGISTFMAEMLETTTILSNATSNSFVIVDELGRGTSTHDGYGLAWGIADYIAAKIQCICLFATHFHELTEMESVIPCVGNLHVTADTSGNQLKMLYKVHPGSCCKSFGINVAQITKFPDAVIATAKNKAASLEAMAESARKRQHPDSMDVDPARKVSKTDEFLLSWLKDFHEAVPGGKKLDESDQSKLDALAQKFDAKIAEFPEIKDIMNEIRAG